MLPEPNATDFRIHLGEFEGRIPWMYLDTAGLVTVGIGHMIPNAEAAAALGFTDGDAAADWATVKQSTPGRIASEYESLSTSRLPDDAIDALCNADSAAMYEQMIRRTPAIATWPPAVQQACLDIQYNVIGGVASFPSMLAACGRGDWTEAAAQSERRPPISEARNAYTRNLILSAGQPSATENIT